jgi:hypothetical protein
LLAAVAVRGTVLWLQSGGGEPQYVVQRLLYVVATATDLPFGQLAAAGAFCWWVARRRERRAARGLGGGVDREVGPRVRARCGRTHVKAPTSVDNVEPDFFEVRITRFVPGPVTQDWQVKTVKELDRLLSGVESEPQFFLGVGAVDPDGCDMGAFSLFVNGDRAWVHLVEGPCWTARDPSFRGKTRAAVEVLDDGGHGHLIPVRETISRCQGLEAVRHWMPRGEMLPELRWGRA